MSSYYEWIKEFLVSPRNAFQKAKKVGIEQAFKRMLPLFIFSAILTTIVSTVFLTSFLTSLIPDLPLVTAESVIVGIGSSLFYDIIGTVAIGLWIHLWLYFVGAKNGVEKTLLAVFYSSIPSLLLSWIPIIGFTFLTTNIALALILLVGGFGVLVIWGLYLFFMGLKMYQNLKTGQIIKAIILSIIIPIAIIGAFAIFAIGLFASFIA